MVHPSFARSPTVLPLSSRFLDLPAIRKARSKVVQRAELFHGLMRKEPKSLKRSRPRSTRGPGLFPPWLSAQQKLLGGWPTPLKNMSSSVGMIFPIYGKSYSSHVPVTTNQKTSIATVPHTKNLAPDSDSGLPQLKYGDKSSSKKQPLGLYEIRGPPNPSKSMGLKKPSFSYEKNTKWIEMARTGDFIAHVLIEPFTLW